MKTATAPLPPLRSVKVLDQLRERIRYLHYRALLQIVGGDKLIIPFC